ncbi:MAG: YggS family pyridoxal phosphate-dependent enzyme [Lachnospiraceae bacterium]|nr:YggS family pyridoxal phosphate-dependent enzyme [Lachnospiraceae bacterium]
MSTISDNLGSVRENIRKACEKAGRDPGEVTLIAVSKTNPAAAVIDAVENGDQLVFGENKVQELCEKIDEVAAALPEAQIRWHMIGHLQRNKVKYLMGRVELIHSVDSLRLAEEIDKESAKAGVITPILLEVNMAEEESKFGLKAEEVEPLLMQLSSFKHIQVKGLMTIAPYVSDPEENRPVFRAMRELFIDMNAKNMDNISMNILSMGMTGDYQVAVEEGATMVRVGTGIFGARNYSV